jgi:enterochelin esterase-like enzyme
MKSFVLILFLLLTYRFSIAQSFDGLLSSISSRTPEQKNLALDSYFSSGINIPIIEGKSTVIFIYRGKADSVFLAGDATGWAPSLKLSRIEGTDTWFCKAAYEPDARLEYKLVINQTNWILDPLNNRIVTGGTGQNSEFLMPEYQLPLYCNERDIVPWGTYSDTLLHSKFLNENRPVRIYLPAGYEKGSSHYPVLFFHDGFEFFDRTAARDIMDNMTFEKKIRPVIAVFVQPVHRDDEYSGMLQGKYTKFITEELIPYMDANYRTLSTPENRAQFGISNGGNIALWLVASHPEKTAKAAAYSSNVMKNINKAFLRNGCKNQEIYLVLGKYDLPPLIPMVRNLKMQLEGEGCNISYHEYNEGHSWKYWQKYLPEALEYFFPAE